jgi:ribosomal protein S18 acetylase RimI-like enzyme
MKNGLSSEKQIKKISEISKEELDMLANLYCEIWKEPPWNEYFWKPEAVLADLTTQLAKTGAVAYCAIDDSNKQNKKMIGFLWGYQVTINELREISGSDKLDFIFAGEQKVFYMDEIGIAQPYRKKYFAKELTIRMLNDAKSYGASAAILRTDKDAYTVHHLNEGLGFKNLQIYDANYPTRTYLFKVL